MRLFQERVDSMMMFSMQNSIKNDSSQILSSSLEKENICHTGN